MPNLIEQTAHALRQELSKVVVGQEKVIEQMLIALLSGGHVLLQGVPGVAKTLTAKTLAQIIQAKFKRIQFTPDLMPSDIVGTRVFDLSQSKFYTQKGPIFANIVLADEINRAPAKTQAALLEVMEERQVTIEGETFAFEEPFMILATQNPIEFEGTYGLPEAQLDRFMMKIVVDYPKQEEELEVLKRYNLHREKVEVNALLSPEDIAKCRQQIQEIRTEDSILQYINHIVRQTRQDERLFMGSSPRGSIGLLLCSKAKAALEGRDYLTPDDVKVMSLPVLRHRIVLKPESEIDGLFADDILNDLIAKIEVPR